MLLRIVKHPKRLTVRSKMPRACHNCTIYWISELLNNIGLMIIDLMNAVKEYTVFGLPFSVCRLWNK